MLIHTTYYTEFVNTFTEKIVRYRCFGEVTVFKVSIQLRVYPLVLSFFAFEFALSVLPKVCVY